MLVIGLTGGIAAGKSTATAFFQERGVPVIDADEVARDVVAAGTPGLAAVVAAFGSQILQADGTLDRRRLREVVFADPAERRRLEAILHPLIQTEIRARLQQVRGPYCILAVPLLIESAALRALVHRVLVIDVPVEVQVARLMQRDGMSAEQCQAMLAAQASRARRLEAADDVVDNATDVTALQRQLDSMHLRYLELAGQS
ncbi:dephospho-CoA kinase [Immundisolibacter cernigliae]|uniref:Dephospho-CoA kinase n=1 Tax=Immundisolibacter cernigliae TaxID=1810504 RepID=A0A1B1YVX3_9GAMM|nr:dephospho-CoA kinase [Immundisolibacter cernigliae]ANX04964.1 dephospho-CoA kinase [Immundisolibacter cernigliae]